VDWCNELAAQFAVFVKTEDPLDEDISPVLVGRGTGEMADCKGRIGCKYLRAKCVKMLLIILLRA
jgi:hypothetical protein